MPFTNQAFYRGTVWLMAKSALQGGFGWKSPLASRQRGGNRSSSITGILNGQRAITGDTALRLGHFFGTSPEFWLSLQSLYELRMAEQRAGKTIGALPRLKRRKGRPER